MKKQDELEFRRLVERDRAAGQLTNVEELGARIGMHPKRATRLVMKWPDWDWGTSARFGWFTKEAPSENQHQ